MLREIVEGYSDSVGYFIELKVTRPEDGGYYDQKEAENSFYAGLLKACKSVYGKGRLFAEGTSWGWNTDIEKGREVSYFKYHWAKDGYEWDDMGGDFIRPIDDDDEYGDWYSVDFESKDVKGLSNDLKKKFKTKAVKNGHFMKKLTVKPYKSYNGRRN